MTRPGTSSSNPIPRPAARVVVVDENDRVLLFHGQSPTRSWWLTPGGGLNQGETYEAAALRELREETGITDATLGPWIWTRKHTYQVHGTWFDQTERIYLVRVANATVDTSGFEENEKSFIDGHRWWTVDEILASPDEFSPRSLGQHLKKVLDGKIPQRAIDVSL